MAARAENNAEGSKASEGGGRDPKSLEAIPALPAAPDEAGIKQAAAPAHSAAAAYQQAQVRYEKNDFKGALESMRESYRLCQRPELLYNIAMLERELGECSSALADYRSYVQQVPQGRYREAAEKASNELSDECPVAATAPPPSPVPPPAALPLVTNVGAAPAREPSNPVITRADAPYWTPPRIIGWSAVTAGMLAGAGAAYFTAVAIAARNDFQRSIDAAKNGTGTYDPGLQDKQHRNQIRAQALAVSGGALVASGVLVLLFSKDGARAQVVAQVQAQPAWLGAVYSRRF